MNFQPKLPDLPRYQPASAMPRGYQPGGYQCSPEALSQLQGNQERARKHDECAEQAEQYRLQTDDLIQQTRAADASAAQAVLAYEGGWIALWATLGGLWTLIAAACAAFYAREAARHTQEQVTLAKDQHKRTTDASVSVHQVSIVHQRWVSFQIILHNRGHANANRCALSADVALITRPKNAPEELMEVWRQDRVINADAKIISPGQNEYWNAPTDVVESIVKEFRERRNGNQFDIFVYISFNYETELGDTVTLTSTWSSIIEQYENDRIDFMGATARHGTTKETRRPISS